MNTLVKLKYITDINLVINDYKYIIKKIRRINRVLKNNREKFNLIETNETQTLFERFDSKENIVVTNILNKNIKKFSFFEANEYNMTDKFDFIFSKKRYYVYSDYEYFGTFRKGKYIIHDINKNCIFKIRIKKHMSDNSLKLENLINNEYSLKEKNDFIDLYDKTFDDKDEFATIQCDILKEKLYHKISASLWLYDNNYYEISMLLTLGICLLYIDYFKTLDMKIKMIMATAISNN
ncbi:hypothetical protein [Peloplasma aerotolerans]|uniref:Uncharacterized protein n=1 Tax=Peloplasma aerotolerans TaxID=3044389 RepID=A0AAW6U215_9MOLU|nr:hypothetical protein [Mariniplasma sp. M4Ah]MDI6451942.1 hypothetical protein [Mariniplasma sp. M4Ah]